MEHYLIVRITERSSANKAGILRKLIHRFALENDIVLADNLVREDRAFFPNGHPVPYQEAKKLFQKITN